MTEVVDRMCVHGSGDALALHLSEHRCEHFVARSAGPHLREGDVLHPIRVGEGLLKACGGVGLARLQDVSDMLSVGRKAHRIDPEVHVQMVPPLNDFRIRPRSRRELRGLAIGTLDGHSRWKPFTKTEIVDVLPQPPLDVL